VKASALFLVVLFGVLGRLSAQVSVDIALVQEQFLSGETLNASVLVTNRSGQVIRFGSDDSWLTFTIESQDHFVVSRNGTPPVAGEFALESSKRAIKTVELTPYFNFSNSGRYTITATIWIKEWNQQFTSAPKAFEIIQGVKLWEEEVGVPKPDGATNAVPELRRYVLQQANYLRKQLMLYLQITDRTGKVYRVFPLGPMLSFGQPEAQVDKISNLHVLYQTGPHSFSYIVVNPDGTVIVRQTYDYTTRPRLTMDDEGKLKVVGGARRVTVTDVPTFSGETNR
jgi:hypothetical protein